MFTIFNHNMMFITKTVQNFLKDCLLDVSRSWFFFWFSRDTESFFLPLVRLLDQTLFKELREEIAPIIKIPFDRSLQTGKHPADWLTAKVMPVFKKGDKSLAANYRPISLTCILCKVFEHILANIFKHLMPIMVVDDVSSVLILFVPAVSSHLKKERISSGVLAVKLQFTSYNCRVGCDFLRLACSVVAKRSATKL